MTVVFAGVTVATPLLPTYQEQWNLSETTTTALFVAYVAGVVIALLLLGQAADVYGPRPVVAAAVVIATAGGVVNLFADSAATLTVGRVLQGLAAGLIPGATAATLATTRVSATWRSRLISIATTTGIAVGLVLGGFLVDRGVTVVWYAYLGAMLPCMAWALTMLFRAERYRTQHSLFRVPLVIPSTGRGRFIGVLAIAAVTFAGMAVYAGVGPRLVGSGAEDSIEVGAAVAAGCYVISGLAQLTVGRRVSGPRWGAAALAVGSGCLAAAVALTNLGLLFVSAALVGMANGLLFPITLTAADRIAPDGRRAAAISTYYLAMYCGIALPLLGAGALADVIGFTNAVQGLALAIGAAALVIAATDAAVSHQRESARI
ncbi:MFS transporter [Gordonia sp. HNM0687]|uniref:MFS transporter n=1 Tax=Gordonia mangrovi TaxID=2665643 RepID=A0A6L7GRM7_9ACTN|nr:MFS transporter [Gordonia mangrovi]MXP21781.1 MFS transporter [Gordonia mangrovi]UVF80507.1 MFS transporter [Gordonia mangrovi]